jgi:hypothetical protein
LEAFYANDTNGGTLWTPAATDGNPEDIAVPYLLSIPALIVNLLRDQGQAQTPHEVLRTIDEYLPNDAYTATLDWGLLRKWCLVASQTGIQQNKSKLNLHTTPVTTDDEEFDWWMGNRLDVSFGPWPLVAASVPQPVTTASKTVAEYLALSKMLATNMLQFSQNIATQVGTVAPIGGGNTALATGKGFDQDQIAKLKDVCGVHLGAHIPTIWAVIQASKGKSYDSYRAHISNAMEAWARTNHIEVDKSIHLDSKFFDDLVALRFNPGGPVVQYQSAARGMSMLACRAVSAVDAKYLRD